MARLYLEANTIAQTGAKTATTLVSVVANTYRSSDNALIQTFTAGSVTRVQKGRWYVSPTPASYTHNVLYYVTWQHTFSGSSLCADTRYFEWSRVGIDGADLSKVQLVYRDRRRRVRAREE